MKNRIIDKINKNVYICAIDAETHLFEYIL